MRKKIDKNPEIPAVYNGVLDFSSYSKNIIGQPQVQELLADIALDIGIRNSRIHTEETAFGTVGNYMFTGPTGVGKTETVEYLATQLHGRPQYMRINCGEYQHSHEVAKLIGAPPGYLGHRESQPLLSQARISSLASETSGISILLFDEFEKADRSLEKILLGIMDHGSLRLGDNSYVNLSRCLLFFTTNLGVAQANKRNYNFVKFAANEENPYVAATRRAFSPEFVNRLNAIIPFRPLTENIAEEITELHVNRLLRPFEADLLKISVRPAVIKAIAREGYSVEYGAREIIRTIRKLLIRPLQKAYMQGTLKLGSLITVNSVNPLKYSEDNKWLARQEY